MKYNDKLSKLLDSLTAALFVSGILFAALFLIFVKKEGKYGADLNVMGAIYVLASFEASALSLYILHRFAKVKEDANTLLLSILMQVGGDPTNVFDKPKASSDVLEENNEDNAVIHDEELTPNEKGISDFFKQQ